MATSGLREAGHTPAGSMSRSGPRSGPAPHYQRLLYQLYDCIHTMAMNLSEIHVAIGCKWGNHRSVAMVEDLGTSLRGPSRNTFDFHATICHLEQFRWDRSRTETVDLQWKDKKAISFRA